MYDNAEVVHLLDLSMLSYHLHSQTLIWPMDPYYDQLTGKTDRRNNFMHQVHNTATPVTYPGTRGPGSLNGWATNLDLDPVLSDYSLINPWRPSVTRANGEKEGWILYDTPPAITGRISTVNMFHYNPANPPPNVVVTNTQILPPNVGRPDLLCCFEGGTGGLPRKGTQHAWSMMGSVLAREDVAYPDPITGGLPPGYVLGTNPYDVYIVFRGSRSGNERIYTALTHEKGNPDWVTDMDFGFNRGVAQQYLTISQTGHVAPGFATSAQSMLPTIMSCLDHISVQKNGARPRTIYVTGHSLGAALAVHFTSAVLMGTAYRHNANGTSMPPNIRQWPWGSIHLLPFALPVVGNGDFEDAFNLTLASRMVALQGDPVTQRTRRHAVGLAYEIDPDAFKVKPFGSRHQPYNIRRWLIEDLRRTLVPISNALANTSKLVAGDNAREPMTVFNDCKDLLRYLSHYSPNDPVANILGPNFNNRLRLYFNVLRDIAPQNTQADVNVLRQAISGINNAGYILWGQVPIPILGNLTLNDIYQARKDIYGSDFGHFIGLCLFLSVASKTTFGNAYTQGLQIVPFQGLKLQ